MQANTRKWGREDADQMLLNASCKSSGSDPKLGSDETQKPDSSRTKLPGTWGPGAKLLFGQRDGRVRGQNAVTLVSASSTVNSRICPSLVLESYSGRANPHHTTLTPGKSAKN